MRKIVDKSMLGKAWIVATQSNNSGSSINIIDDNLIEQILYSRGITGVFEVEKFLNPSIKEYMPDPDVLMDMDKAAKIIADAVIKKEKIAVYGDYDVDGITSTAVFVKYLREFDADVIWHLPTREGEGYGLNIEALETIAKEGVKLVITVDCGISGTEEVAYAKNIGMQIVVTDHHSPESVLPDADAIVNPKRKDDTSGLSYLAGVGVAFLTLVAVNREMRERAKTAEEKEKIENINLLNYLDLVALGTICDTMPLVGLNRAFVSTGLKVMGLRNNLGLRVLMDISSIKKASVYAVGFALGPRLNAAGRLDSAAPALELLLTDNILIANDLANKLHKMNQERIDIQNSIMINATEMAKFCCKSDNKVSLFVCGDNWHGGVMGIIAGRLKDKYNLPSCVATKVDGIINGSGRSIPGVDLGKIIHDALEKGVISEGGGHAAAAGFTLPSSKEEEFCKFLEEEVLKQLNGEAPTQEIMIDAQIDAGGANMELVQKLSSLEPFGQGNPEPTIVLHGATLAYATIMGNGSHLRGMLNTSSGKQLPFVGFNLVGTDVGDFLLDDANTNTKITMLGKLKENDYRGRVSAQFILEDMVV
ncbi:MAG: single-stranded-DNA-specific exonuclease RecJ [Alphaproteobacteria bacterium]|nr:single-stranded-DNA-specific exonuclease RecJ [Alphaproteobacteria bacterium]MBN2675551.1 single-stranded-DNA-specific exonuclease RecJ [Alphaproteobacteria bacterium]